MDVNPEQPWTRLDLTAESVKVLAHPLRSRLLSALRRGGPASATALAAELATNTGATSYHLRKLESVGLVEDTGAGRGKERLWQAATESHGWSHADLADDEDARTALGWLVRDYHRQFDVAYSRWLDVAESWPEPWQEVSGMGDAWVEVTPDQARRMQAEIDAVVARYAHAGEGDDRARRLHLYMTSFPLEPDDVPVGEDTEDEEDTGAPGADG